jgi:hypothetical protein
MEFGEVRNGKENDRAETISYHNIIKSNIYECRGYKDMSRKLLKNGWEFQDGG